jgi:trypsin
MKMCVNTSGVPFNSKPMLDGRIVGGTETDITSHPYQVSVLLTDFYLCGGSIVSANWVLTDAACVSWFSLSSITVRSGSTYSNSSGTIHNATNVLIDEKYENFTEAFGVALLEVDPPFNFSDSVQPITLECDPVPVGSDVVVSGWGPTSESDELSTTLREVTVQITSDSECNSTYGDYWDFTDRMLCAGDSNGGKGPCWGDYGSPLVASSRLVAIYAWGVGCGLAEYPDLYTKMSDVCDWVVANAGV